MFQYNRLNEILNHVQINEYISCQRLSSLFKVTDRTIRSDIQNINDEIEKFGAKINLKRKHGYYLTVEDKPKFDDFLVKLERSNESSIELDSSEDRIKYALNILLYNNDYITLEDLADEVFVSKNTLTNYIRTIKPILSKYNLEYISKTNAGIKVIGNEIDKRKCVIDNVLTQNFQSYVVGFTKDEYTLFDGIDLDTLKEIVKSHLKEKNFKTSDFNLKNLIVHFALMISRVENDCYINTDNSIKIPGDTYNFINSLIDEIENTYAITVSEGEKKYLYLHMIANVDFNVAGGDENQIENTVILILETVYQDYNFDLRKDEILFKDLCNHLKSIFSTKSYAMNKRNPLLNTIKTNFPLAFEITLTVTTKIFNEDPYILTEDEVGYISLHIGAAIERCFSGTIERKSVILVCGSGQATTRMLEARLNVFFNDKIKICRRASYNEFISYTPRELKNIDFIVSTIPLKSDIIPTITVDFSLRNSDIESISRFISEISQDKAKKVDRFFDKRLFNMSGNFKNKNELIENLCNMLGHEGYVEADFINGVMERESLANTNMNEVFALPHPMEVCANKTKVAVAILDKPIVWNGSDTVQIVFLLAIKHGDQQDIEHLYDIFIEIVNNPKLQQEILHSQNYEEFLNSLYQHI